MLVRLNTLSMPIHGHMSSSEVKLGRKVPQSLAIVIASLDRVRNAFKGPNIGASGALITDSADDKLAVDAESCVCKVIAE
jgi:hypothetical protein